jgi:Mor family transcriptional regulator
MSDLMIRELASACAEKMGIHVESAVQKTVRDHLPAAIEAVLRERYQGEVLHIYVAKRSPASRRDRDAAIRTMYNGRNAKAIAHQFGLSISQVFRIAALK